MTAAMLLFAAAGIGLFGLGHGIGALMAGRLLIGIGVGCYLWHRKNKKGWV